MSIRLGSYYETDTGEIVYVFGVRDGKLMYFYEDDRVHTPEVTVDHLHKHWKLTDLRDFPNARDPRVPYVFDLFWDIKYLSELKHELAKEDCEETLWEKAIEHGYVSEADKPKYPPKAEDLRTALQDLVSVLNEDKDGGYFICAEAEDVVRRAIKVLGG